MVEREMQELLWQHPDRCLNEPMKQVAWEASSDVGRADLVFEDRHGRLLIIEVKRGKLPRGAIDQLLDYFGMMKQRFPNRPVEMMVVANSIPSERRLACESRDIECREISEKRFREVAAEVGYIFKSDRAISIDNSQDAFAAEGPCSPAIRGGTEFDGAKDRRAGEALYLVVRHPRKPPEKGKKLWINKWQDDCRIEIITTKKSLGELCEAERRDGNVVYIYRCEFKEEHIPSAITCTARVGNVEYLGNEAVVHFVVDKVLGETGEGMPTTAEQRYKARRAIKYRAPAL